MFTNKYLISGIGPGSSGVGRLMNNLINLYNDKNCKLIFRRSNTSLSELRFNRNYISFYYEIILRIIDDIIFRLKLFKINNSRIILIHPQTVGFNLLFRLLKNNKIYLYIADNSFFCVCSYNVHPISNFECLKCVGKVVPDHYCIPAPVRYSLNVNSHYLKKLQSNYEKIVFLAQNKNQKKLLKLHFGCNAKVFIVGMDTNEIKSSYVPSFSILKYDIVFHGNSLIAKGIIYALELSKKLPNYTFFIPDSYENINKLYSYEIPPNVTCKKVTWETGLQHIIANAKLALNPSLWSAPIEGALIKSAHYNKNVATVITQYGYESEIQIIHNHLRLSPDVNLAAHQVTEFFSVYDLK